MSPDGITPILSYNYGYKKHGRLNDTLKLASKVNLVVGVILFFIIFIWKTIGIIICKWKCIGFKFSSKGVKNICICLLLCGFNIINSGYFTAIGDAKASIIIAASRGIVFIILGIKILPTVIGISGVWLTVPFAECMTFIMSMYLVQRKNKYESLMR